MSGEPPGLPPGWAQTCLGEIGCYHNGRAFKKSEWRASGRPIVRIQDLTGTSNSPNYFEGKVEPRHEVEAGDLLVSWAATLGAYIWRGPPAVVNQHIFKVDSLIDREFHFFALQRAIDHLYGRSHGTGMVHVTRGVFDSAPVLLPPRGEQRRIVSALESYFTRLDNATATLERVQRNLERYRASVLKAAVEGRLVPTEAELARKEGRDYEPASVLLQRILAERRRRWEEAELAKLRAKGKEPKDDAWKKKHPEPVAPDTTGLPDLPEGWCWASLDALLRDPLRNGHSARESATGQGVPTLTLSAVTQGDFSENNIKRTVADPAKVQDLWVEPGDIFVERSNTKELVGLSALYEGAPHTAIFPDLLVRVRPSHDLEYRYVAAALLSGRARRFLSSRAQGIAGTMPKISQSVIAAVPVPLPPIAEQRRIVDELACRRTVQAKASETVAVSFSRAQRLRQSILKWAFEGKLVDQDPADEPAAALLVRIRAERDAASPGQRDRGTSKVDA